MWLIAGLGNPGDRYRRTRHNVGFMVVDRALQCWNAGKLHRRGKSLLADLEYSGESVRLAKPQTSMNLSGQAIQELMEDDEKGAPTLVVVFDDFNLPLGQIRLRERGGGGGHRGMESIIESIGTEDFLRLRLGIADAAPVEDAVEFVLDRFPASAAGAVEEMIDTGVGALETLMTVGPAKTMSVYNRRL